MFIDAALAARIDAGEARLSSAIARTLQARGVPVELTPVAGGLSVLAQAGSQVNKVIGAGFVPDDAALAAVEAAWWARGEAVRFEVATLANPPIHTYLTARGYQLRGFEHVLTRRLTDAALPASDVTVERVGPEDGERWLDVSLAGWGAPDGTGAATPPHEQGGLREVFGDFLRTDAIAHYLASIDGVPAGSGSARYDQDGIAYLVGASTAPAYRRRGVQRAILNTRLAAARAAGCELAVVTTDPGSQSQANVIRAGFAVGYARAVLVRPPPA